MLYFGKSILQSIHLIFMWKKGVDFLVKVATHWYMSIVVLIGLKTFILPHSTLSFPQNSADEEDHRMDWLKRVGIFEDTNGRFNNAKNIEFMSMQMYLFIQYLQNWRIWHLITSKLEVICFEFSFSSTQLFLIQRLKDAVYPTINQWLCEKDIDSSLSQGK